MHGEALQENLLQVIQTWREKLLTVISEANMYSSNGILNDKRTIDLPIFCFGGAPAIHSMLQSILVEYILCLTVTRNITGYGLMNI